MKKDNISFSNITENRLINRMEKETPILSSNIKLIRNISGYNFNSLNDKSEKDAILKSVIEAKSKIKLLSSYNFLLIRDISRLQRQLLVDRKVILQKTSQKVSGKAVILKNQKSADNRKLLSVVCNEDEHLKIQCALSGANLSECYREVIKIESQLEKQLSFSFSSNLGYLMSNPSILGTGLKASIMIHVPAMVISTKIIEFIKNLNQVGFGVSGFFGEGTEIIGNIFVIANLITLGKTEESIIEELSAISKNVIDEELSAMDELKENNSFTIEDTVYRSFGMIKYAKILSYDESLELLSILRLGLDLGIIDEVKEFDFYKLINTCSDSNIEISYIKDKKATMDEIDFVRACIIRDMILK